MRKLLLIPVLAALACPGAVAQSRGDWVLGQWRGGEYWFPGVVQARTGDKVTIAYDDGTQETVAKSRIKPYTWTLGTRVECRWAGGKAWYAGEITSVSSDGTRINISYDDGERERLATGACRSR